MACRAGFEDVAAADKRTAVVGMVLWCFGPARQEGAGEVQSPLRGKAARDLRLGDAVWFRHANAGEMCERFDEVVLLEGGRAVGEIPTYRGEGHNFG